MDKAQEVIFAIVIMCILILNVIVLDKMSEINKRLKVTESTNFILDKEIKLNRKLDKRSIESMTIIYHKTVAVLKDAGLLNSLYDDTLPFEKIKKDKK